MGVTHFLWLLNISCAIHQIMKCDKTREFPPKFRARLKDFVGAPLPRSKGISHPGLQVFENPISPCPFYEPRAHLQVAEYVCMCIYVCMYVTTLGRVDCQ